MTFVVRKLKHRPWPVTITFQVSSETGEVTEVESTFVAHFRPFTEAEFAGLLAANAGGAADGAETDLPPQEAGAQPRRPRRPRKPGADGAETDLPPQEVLRRNAEVFAALIVGWGSQMVDEEGMAIPFSVEVLKALVTGPDGLAVSQGINRALGEIRFGVAPLKNSPTSPQPGPTPAVGEAASTS